MPGGEGKRGMGDGRGMGEGGYLKCRFRKVIRIPTVF